ncbi:flavin reductase family protein [Segetibacter koreensis]|uniref:flavin reductase family protein n=1 Tax=Segetibacter koreensis TaxID=398037 RepID=UPI00036E18FB|nr:flavin reductase family protein [Segetibacter koreensis]
MIFSLKDLSTLEKQYYLQHVIAPRPICFASTIDKEGTVNLSPFSFFNMFSSNPPIVIFSPSRRVRDNTTKHTLQNVSEVPEVVINIVTYDLVQQTSLASGDYPKGTDEFIKAGFTKEEAAIVTPPMVKESKVKLECKVLEIKSLGAEAGAGNLVICEVLYLHVDNSLLTKEKKFIQTKLELVARLGGEWYCKVSSDNLFIVPKPNVFPGIGIDTLPENIRNSKTLTGNHLGKLATVEKIPDADPAFQNNYLKNINSDFINTPESQLHSLAAKLLDEDKINEAWQCLLLLNSFKKY